jgi:predicted Zn-dependent protease
VQLTWVAHRGSIYRITGVASPRAGSRYDATFFSVARSFRPLPPEARQSIRERRLRIARARSGETLPQLSQRTGNLWNVQETAVMNGVFANARLESGQLVKVALPERYEQGNSPGAPPSANR